MNEYTLTTEEIRARATRSTTCPQLPSPTLREDWGRWLAAHDPEMWASERERIIQDMEEASHADDWGVPCIYVSVYANRLRDANQDGA